MEMTGAVLVEMKVLVLAVVVLVKREILMVLLVVVRGVMVVMVYCFLPSPPMEYLDISVVAVGAVQAMAQQHLVVRV